MTRSDTSPFHKPLRHGKYGEAHDCRPLAFDSRDKEGAEALYGVGTGLVVAFAGGRVGAEHVFGPPREGHVGGVVKQFRPAFPASRQPDDAAPRVYGMRPAREVQQHGEGFVAAGGLAEDDRAVFLVQYDDGIGTEDHRVGRFGPGGAGYGFGLGLRRPHGIGGGIVFQGGGGFGAVHNLDGKVDAEAAEQFAPAGRG